MDALIYNKRNGKISVKELDIARVSKHDSRILIDDVSYHSEFKFYKINKKAEKLDSLLKKGGDIIDLKRSILFSADQKETEAVNSKVLDLFEKVEKEINSLVSSKVIEEYVPKII